MFTLSKIKIHDDVSEETLCFSADICVAGKVVGHVKNDGRGGSHTYWWSDPEAGRRIEAWAREQPTEFDFEKLDQLVDGQLTRHERVSWLMKQIRRKKTVFKLKMHKKGEWLVLAAPCSPEVVARLRAKYGIDLVCVANEDLNKAVEVF